MEVVKKDVYVSHDGKEFTSEQECINHEKELAAQKKRLEGLKVYSVSHSFDETEGKGYFGKTYIITDQREAYVIQYCLDRFGKILDSWYGNSHYVKWHIHPRTEKNAVQGALKQKGTKSSYGHGAIDIVFLSVKPLDHPDIPEPVFPWPRKQDQPNQ